MTSSLVGRQVGDYRIVSELGEGGMGLVFKGQHVSLGQVVAIKSLHQQLMNNQAARDRFIREAQALARLNHPNIIALLNFINDDTGCFIVMEFAEGEDLEHKIQRMGLIPPEQCLPWFAQACRGLAYAHQQQIIHRDIKPSNIIVHPSGTTKLLDFGTAKLVDAKRLTQQGMTLGTVIYMSKEQLLGKPLDARSDVYSLGVTLYECVTGQLPFYDEEERKLVVKIAKQEPIPPSQHYPGIGKELERIILKAMAKEPEARFQSAEEMAQALEAIGGARVSPAPLAPVAATSLAVPTPTVPAGGGIPLLVIAGLVSLVVGLGSGIGLLVAAKRDLFRLIGLGCLSGFGLLGVVLIVVGIVTRPRGGARSPAGGPQGSVADGKCRTCGRAMLAGAAVCPFCFPSTPSAGVAAATPVGTLNVNSAQAAQGMSTPATLAAPAAAGQATLKITDGPDKGKVVTVRPGAPCAIGRAPDCQLVLADAGVSGHHAAVRYEGAQLVVEDTGSRNGVYVNNVKTPRQALKSGDLIVIGSTRMLITVG